MSTLLSKFDEAAKKGAKNCRNLRPFPQKLGQNNSLTFLSRLL